MARIQIDIPAARQARVEDAFAGLYGYSPTIMTAPGVVVPNPETKATFVARKLREHIQEVVRRWEAESARAAVPDLGLT